LADLEIILTGRGYLPASYSKKMVKVLWELQEGECSLCREGGVHHRQADQVEGFSD
jgi:hypothetical protein